MKIRDFMGFQWNGKHSSQFNLVRVSSGNRYDGNMLSGVTNNTTDIPGGDGQYYYNSTFQAKQFTIDCAFDKLTEQNLRDLSSWLACRELKELIFDEEPYKAYNVKISGKPDLKYLCFNEYDAKVKEYRRIYKGELKITFVAPVPFAHNAKIKTANGNERVKYLKDIRWVKNSESPEEFVIASRDTTGFLKQDDTKSIFELQSLYAKQNTAWSILCNCSTQEKNKNPELKEGYTNKYSNDFKSWYKRYYKYYAKIDKAPRPFPFYSLISPEFDYYHRLAIRRSEDKTLVTFFPTSNNPAKSTTENGKTVQTLDYGADVSKFLLQNIGAGACDYIGYKNKRYVYHKKTANINRVINFKRGSKVASFSIYSGSKTETNPFSYHELKWDGATGATGTVVVKGLNGSGRNYNLTLDKTKTYKVEIIKKGTTDSNGLWSNLQVHFIDYNLYLHNTNEGGRYYVKQNPNNKSNKQNIVGIMTSEGTAINFSFDSTNFEQIKHSQAGQEERVVRKFDKTIDKAFCNCFKFGGTKGNTSGHFYSSLEKDGEGNTYRLFTFYRPELSKDLSPNEPLPELSIPVRLTIPIEDEAYNLAVDVHDADGQVKTRYSNTEDLDRLPRNMATNEANAPSGLCYRVTKAKGRQFSSNDYINNVFYDYLNKGAGGTQVYWGYRFWSPGLLKKTFNSSTKKDEAFEDEIEKKLAEKLNDSSIEFSIKLIGFETLYSNINEWDFASGLKENSKVINTSGNQLQYKDLKGVLRSCYYDIPYISPRNSSTEYTKAKGYENATYFRTDINGMAIRVYNPGDIDVPFKLRLNLVGTLNSVAGTAFTISLRQIVPDGSDKILHTMTLKYNTSDGTDSLKEAIKSYHNVWVAKGNTSELTEEGYLEIDSARQGINVISKKDGKETKKPAQFLLKGGDFFKIPPKLDNLYIFIYTKNVDNVLEEKYFVRSSDKDNTAIGNFVKHGTGTHNIKYTPCLFDRDRTTIDYNYLYF